MEVNGIFPPVSSNMACRQIPQFDDFPAINLHFEDESVAKNLGKSSGVG
jgi:hypothetical protein